MEAYSNSSMNIIVRDEEISTLRTVLNLAYRQLHSSPVVKLRGVPLERQAGLCGPELFQVKQMLEKLGKAAGADLPMDPPEKSLEVEVTVSGGPFPPGFIETLIDAGFIEEARQ